MDVKKRITEAMNWRYAVKRMNGKKITEDELNTILDVIRLAPTAYGLQAFSVVVTENEAFLNSVFEQACNQIVIKQCSHLLIFKTPKKLEKSHMDAYLQKLRDLRSEDNDIIKHNRVKLQHLIDNQDTNKKDWLAMQTYIILGYVTLAAAMLGIDATPMEGFSPVVMDKLLNLDSQKEGTTVMIALGHRDEESDVVAQKAKIRKEASDLIQWI